MKTYPSQRGDRCDSKYERDVVDSLIERGISYVFHPGPFSYDTPVLGGFCLDCDGNSVRQGRQYTPDLELLPSGVLVEVKGRFDTHQRGLMAHFIRTTTRRVAFIFMRDNRMRKGAKSRYSNWAKRQKVPYAVGMMIPAKWADDF